jgi:hypothetical protein
VVDQVVDRVVDRVVGLGWYRHLRRHTQLALRWLKRLRWLWLSETVLWGVLY